MLPAGSRAVRDCSSSSESESAQQAGARGPPPPARLPVPLPLPLPPTGSPAVVGTRLCACDSEEVGLSPPAGHPGRAAWTQVRKAYSGCFKLALLPEPLCSGAPCCVRNTLGLVQVQLLHPSHSSLSYLTWMPAQLPSGILYYWKGKMIACTCMGPTTMGWYVPVHT